MKTIVGIVGGGGREHAIAEAYAKSAQVDEIIVMPGNDFLKEDISKRFGKPVRTYPDIKVTETERIIEAAKKEQVSLLDVAQDNALAVNVAGRAREEGMLAVGPDEKGSRVESDKAWFREYGKKWGIPQPAYETFEDAKQAIAWVDSQPDQPYFIKAAYLAEGKGVVPAENRNEAKERIRELIRKFPTAAKKIVIEEWLKHADGGLGDEFSAFFLTDGNACRFAGMAVDYKRVFDNDTGENTGSMGSNSPTNLLSEEQILFVKTQIAEKVVQGLRHEGIVYQGIMYVSSMVVRGKDGTESIQVIEVNSRWGDPEAEVVIPSIQTDFFVIMLSIAKRTLAQVRITHDNLFRVVVTGASKGYPGDYAAVNGKEIIGLHDAQTTPGVHVYGAGMKITEGKYIANGGRLFYIVGEGNTLLEARERAYDAMKKVSIQGNNLQYRTDIGIRDMRREG